MTLHTFRSPFVYTHTVNNHEFLKAELMPSILSQYTQNKTNDDYRWARTNTINNHHAQDLSLFTPQILKDMIWNPLDAMFDDMKSFYSIPYKSHLAGIWWNVYTAGSTAQVHDHRGYDLSGVYLLHMNEPNTLTFQPECYDGFFPFTYDILYTDSITQEGTVLFFPSAMKHYVNPCTEMRVSISFNLICDVNKDQCNPMKVLIA